MNSLITKKEAIKKLEELEKKLEELEHLIYQKGSAKMEQQYEVIIDRIEKYEETMSEMKVCVKEVPLKPPTKKDMTSSKKVSFHPSY